MDLEHRTVIDVSGAHTTAAIEQWLPAPPEIHTIPCGSSAVVGYGFFSIVTRPTRFELLW